MTNPWDAPFADRWPVQLSTEEKRNVELKLERAKLAFERGDKGALLLAINQCALFSVPLPRWVSGAFVIAYYDVARSRRYLSWDEVFGTPHPKHVRRISLNDAVKDYRVYRRVLKLREQKPRRDVFPEVAKEFGISVGVARKYFQQISKEVNRLNRLRSLPNK